MEKNSERKRKAKGSLSVLDEFTGDAGSISFAPQISDDVQRRIDEKTRRADMPTPAHASLVVEPIRSLSETRDPEQNLGQSSDKKNESSDNPKTEPRTILGQSSDKKNESSDNPKTEPRTKPRTTVGQSSDNPRTVSAFQALSGLQKNITHLIYEICRSKGGRATGPVSIELLFQTLDSTRLSVQKSIQRLEQKQIVIRRESRSGRGGWTVYELPENIWSQILQTETSDKSRTIVGQTSDNPKTEPKTEPRTTLSSSSRNLLIKEESTTTQSLAVISQIDLSLVQKLGITASVLARCIELYPVLQPEQLEVLVFRFAEFAKDPKNKVQNARGFFISLAEQASKGQVPLDHIETPDERLMRLFIERQKEAKIRRVDVERAALELECEVWLESLTSEMKLTLIPETAILKAGTAAHTAMLKNYFAEQVWPGRRTEILEKEAIL